MAQYFKERARTPTWTRIVFPSSPMIPLPHVQTDDLYRKKRKRGKNNLGADWLHSAIRKEGPHYPDRGDKDERGKTKDRECYYCKKVLGIRSRTIYVCKKCMVYLHPECFAVFHESWKYYTHPQYIMTLLLLPIKSIKLDRSIFERFLSLSHYFGNHEMTNNSLESDL